MLSRLGAACVVVGAAVAVLALVIAHGNPVPAFFEGAGLTAAGAFAMWMDRDGGGGGGGGGGRRDRLRPVYVPVRTDDPRRPGGRHLG